MGESALFSPSRRLVMVGEGGAGMVLMVGCDCDCNCDCGRCCGCECDVELVCGVGDDCGPLVLTVRTCPCTDDG